jgi:hypothetical protein
LRLESASRILAVHEALAIQNTRLAELATVDDLTGVKNRRRFRVDLDLYFALSSRHARPLSLVMLDVDHFRRDNDTFGHPAGDEIINMLIILCVDGEPNGRKLSLPAVEREGDHRVVRPASSSAPVEPGAADAA